MSRDEYRAKCIEAMSVQIIRYCDGAYDPASLEWARTYFELFKMETHAHNMGATCNRCVIDDAVAQATAAFDALHGIAWVVPVEATGKMIAAAWRVLNPCGENCIEKWGTGPAVKEAYAAMAAAGDLTEPPEKKT